MTEQDAILGLNTLRNNCRYRGDCGYCQICYGAVPMAIKALEKIQQYKAIGTVEEFKALKEKAEPKKVLEEKDKFNTPHWYCPVCRCELYSGQEYCDECGQNLDSEV